MITNKDIRVEGRNLIINGERHPLDPAVDDLIKRANIVQGKFSALDTRVDAIEALEKTASGNPISLTGAAEAYAMALNMAIEPIQSGSGDPSPTNVRPISGLTEGKVVACGKNIAHIDSTKIFNTNKNPSDPITGIADGMLILGAAANGYIRVATLGPYTINNPNSITAEIVDNATFGVGIVVEVDTSKTYALNLVKTGGVVEVGWLNSDGSFLSSAGQQTLPVNLTPPTGAKYLLIVCLPGLNTENTFSDIQLEEGTTATPFEPYTATTATITFGQTVYGGSVNFKTGKVTVTHGMVDLGTLDWNAENSALSGLFRVNYDASLNLKFIGDLKCSKYKGAKTSYYADMQDKTVSVTNSEEQPILRLRDTTYENTTAADFKTAMSGVQLCYELATPTTLTLTPAELELLKGANTISGNGVNISMSYLGR